MRSKFTLLLVMAAMGTLSQAQTTATFDDLSLAHPDTFYVNYSASGSDVGFDDGLAHFPCVYDTSYGGYWSYGFAYSNMTDSVTSGYTNGYSAKTGIGYEASANYAVAYGISNIVNLHGVATEEPSPGFYVTNNTYAYNSMRDGDFVAKKFGDTTGTGLTTGAGTAPDWFKVVIRGFSGGTLTADSVEFYLADFRFADNDSDYIVNTWQHVSLLPLGHVDSLSFTLSSSDNDPMYGMNTPAYFCMDNFTTGDIPTAVNQPKAIAAKVYPNPATNVLYVDVANNDMQQLSVTDMAGNVVHTEAITSGHMAVSTATLAPGIYLLRLSGSNASATIRFTKD